MAAFTSYYLVSLDIDPDNNTARPNAAPLQETYNAQGDFSEGGVLHIEDSVFVFYLGHIEGGWLGVSPSNTYYLFSVGVPPTETFSYATDGLVVCFLAGTRIATPGGPTPVEALGIGDLVTTAAGDAAPVRWVGRRTVASVFVDPLTAFPIRIAAGALGEGSPTRDLFVSPDHALMIGGLLVQAGALVNGTTIVREAAMPERFTYFHVELADHALILAEGVPAETFVDNVTRRRFDNHAEYVALHGDAVATIAEMELPRAKSARQVPRSVRALLDARTARLGTRDASAA
jgi:hypothetical protein